MSDSHKQAETVKPQLGLWDAVSIIVGIVIGSSIYKTPPLIMNNVSGPWQGLGVWALCGLLSLAGALCYAELASTYPRSGGDYVYLTRAFGPLVGFLFGWAQLAVILTSSIGLMGFVFAEYAVQLWDLGPSLGPKLGLNVHVSSIFVLASLAVIALTLLNVLGVVFGKWIQNLLTATKVLGLGGILVAGFGWGQTDAWTVTKEVPDASFGTAVILVLYAYGGWNDAAFVAADLRQPRLIARALVMGTAGITVIYLAINAAYIQGLGFEGVRQFGKPVAAAVLERPLGAAGSKAMSVLVMISALGAINGLIFTGSRVYASLGAEHSILAVLGRWNRRFGSPVWALLIQALISIGFIAGAGTKTGRSMIDRGLSLVRVDPLPWDKYFGGFDTLFAGTAPVFWAFFLLSGLSLFKLRMLDRTIVRPFTVPLYPLVPLLFCGMCAYGIYAASTYAGAISLIGVVPLLIGLPLYCFSRNVGALSQPSAAHAPDTA